LPTAVEDGLDGEGVPHGGHDAQPAATAGTSDITVGRIVRGAHAI